MKFKILKTTDPYYNLAIEEYLFNTSCDDIFLLWQNEPTIVIGKNQNAYAEINHDFVQKNNIHIARRITGGGAVYHDLGNLNYSFICAASGGKGIDFEYFTQPIIEALSSLGVSCRLSGRNDLITSDGLKFSGNAQHSVGNKTLHHGTLLFDSALEILSAALNPSDEKLKSKAIKSTRSRVTNLRPLLEDDFTTDEFIARISDFVQKKYKPDTLEITDCGQIGALAARNASREWIFPDRDLLANYSVVKKSKYPFGIVEIYLEMSNDRICAIDIKGDFFGTADIKCLKQALTGLTLNELNEKAPNNIGDYIFGMRREELIEQIRN